MQYFHVTGVSAILRIHPNAFNTFAIQWYLPCNNSVHKEQFLTFIGFFSHFNQLNQIYFANSEKYILECEINTFYLLTNIYFVGQHHLLYFREAAVPTFELHSVQPPLSRTNDISNRIFFFLSHFLFFLSLICSFFQKFSNILIPYVKPSFIKNKFCKEIDAKALYIKSKICDPHVIFGNHSKEWNANQPPLYQNCQCRNLCPDNKTNCPTFKKRICINQSIVTWLSNKIQARASKNWELCKYIFPSYFQSLVVC